MREKAILISYIKHAISLLKLSFFTHIPQHCSRVISYLLIEINAHYHFIQINIECFNSICNILLH
jgi:hypothetical protein